MSFPINAMEFDWDGIGNLNDAFKLLLNNEFLSDIRFMFPDKKVLYAHSFVLCLRSPEYYKSFKSTIGVTKLIPVNDVPYEAYYEFLKYLYTEECQIDDTNTAEIMQLSKTYEVNNLRTKCTDLTIKSVGTSNVCQLLDMSIETGWDAIRRVALTFISKNYLTVLSNEHFLEISQKTLKSILELEPVSDVNELKIFEQVMKLVNRACDNDCGGLIAPTVCMKRAKLGDNLKLIRFGAMTSEEFGKCQEMEPDLLTSDEIVAIFMNISTKKMNTLGFLDKKRLELEPQTSSAKPEMLFNKLYRLEDSLTFTLLGCCRQAITSGKETFTMVFSVSKAVELRSGKWWFPCPENPEFKLSTGPKFDDDISIERQDAVQETHFFRFNPVRLARNTSYRISYTFKSKDQSSRRMAIRQYVYGGQYPVVIRNKNECEWTIQKFSPHICELYFSH